MVIAVNAIQNMFEFLVQNMENGKCYIGSSVHIRNRISQHKWALSKGKHPSEDMCRDYAKGNTFEVSVLEKTNVPTLTNLRVLESKHISRAKAAHTVLYNTEEIHTEHMTEEQLTKLMADFYCLEHFGMNLYRTLHGCKGLAASGRIDSLYESISKQYWAEYDRIKELNKGIG